MDDIGCVLYDKHFVFWNLYGAVFLALWLRLILLSDGDVATFKSPCCDMHVSFSRALCHLSKMKIDSVHNCTSCCWLHSLSMASYSASQWTVECTQKQSSPKSDGNIYFEFFLWHQREYPTILLSFWTE